MCVRVSKVFYSNGLIPPTVSVLGDTFGCPTFEPPSSTTTSELRVKEREVPSESKREIPETLLTYSEWVRFLLLKKKNFSRLISTIPVDVVWRYHCRSKCRFTYSPMRPDLLTGHLLTHESGSVQLCLLTGWVSPLGPSHLPVLSLESECEPVPLPRTIVHS